MIDDGELGQLGRGSSSILQALARVDVAAELEWNRSCSTAEQANACEHEGVTMKTQQEVRATSEKKASTIVKLRLGLKLVIAVALLVGGCGDGLSPSA